MNLFESQINKLAIGPATKRSVIALRKACMESETGVMPTMTPGETDGNSREALSAIKDTVRKAMAEAGDDYYRSGDSVSKAYYSKIDQYRPDIEKKYGHRYGDALVAEAKKYAHRMSVQ